MNESARGYGAASHDFAMTSPDGVLTVQITVRPRGIVVERTEQRADGRRFIQSMAFDDEATFVRWCQSDDLWFAYPLVFSQLTRSGRELFNAPT